MNPWIPLMFINMKHWIYKHDKATENHYNCVSMLNLGMQIYQTISLHYYELNGFEYRKIFDYVTYSWIDTT